MEANRTPRMNIPTQLVLHALLADPSKELYGVEIGAAAGHSSVTFTLDRYGHLYPEADAALRDRLDALYGTAQPAPASPVVRLRRRPGRGPSVAPGASGNDKSAAGGAPEGLNL